MSAKAGSAGSAGPSMPKDAPGDGGNRNTKSQLNSDDIDAGMLQGVMDGAKTDPKSLDVALLAPLRDQLERFENDPEEDWSGDPKVDLLKATVQTIVDEQTRRLDALAKEIMADFYDAVEAAEDGRRSMVEDERQYRALTRIKDSKRYASDAPDRDVQQDDRIQMHTTRTRTTMYGARLGDVIFPTNDYPLRVVAPENPDPSEYPGYAAASQAADANAMTAWQQASQAAQQAQPPGQPPPQPTPGSSLPIKEYAAAAAAKMQGWMFKQLDAQHFKKKGAEVIDMGCKVGLGLLYGPFPDVSRRRVPKKKPLDGAMAGAKTQTYLDIEVQETKTPGCEVRDPFRFFYDLTPTLEESNACYYVNFWTLRQLTDFKSAPNVIGPTVERMLKDEDPECDPKLTQAIEQRSGAGGSGMKESIKGRYVTVEVDKVLRPETLKEITGVVWDSDDLPLVKMWISDAGCLKFKMTPLERDWRTPYYNFGMQPKDDTIYWYSVPSMGRSGQKFVDGALNATLFNAAASMAPIIVANKGQVTPNNERWRLGSMVVFNNLNPDLPAKDVFASVTVESNVEGNLAMLAQALAMFDDDILYEQILSGNVSGEAIAASQLAQIVNLASVFQRRLAGYADDYVLAPYGERMVAWGNLYEDDDDMKGPHVVKAIAATQFVSKDILIQHLQAFTQMASTNPLFQGFVDAYKLFRANINLMDIPDINDIALDRTEALANQQRLQQAAGGPEAAKMAEVERHAKRDQADVQLAQQKLVQEGQLEAARIRSELIVQASKERVAMLELMTTKQVDMAAIQSDLAAIGVDADTKKQLATLDAVMAARMQQVDLAAPAGHNPHSAKD